MAKQRSHLRWSAAGKHGGPRVHCNMDGVFNFPTNTNDDPADGQREGINGVSVKFTFVNSTLTPFIPFIGKLYSDPIYLSCYELITPGYRMIFNC